MQSLGKPAVMPAQQTERKALQNYLRVGSVPSLPSATPHQEPDDRPTAFCFWLVHNDCHTQATNLAHSAVSAPWSDS